METITLQRVRSEKDCTIGLLTVGKSTFATLEDAQRPVKIDGITAIPAGTYELKLRNKGGMTVHYANKFPDMHEGMIWLQDVRGFSWVYIHIGNFPDDTEGCVLVAMKARKHSIVSSTKAYKRIYPEVVKMIRDKGCQIVIKDDDSDEERDDG